MSLGAVVLAAGQGKRLLSRRAKVLHQALGKPLLDWVLAALESLAPEKIVVVVGHLRQQVEEHLAGRCVELAVQDPPLGTGDAFRRALPFLPSCQRVLVVPGDAPLLTAQSLRQLVQLQEAEDAAAAVLTAVLPEGGSYGRVLRQGGQVVGIVEAADASPQELALREVNAGVYVFHRERVAPHLAHLSAENSQGEYYLTDLVGALVRAGEKVVALPLANPQEMLGVNTRQELAQVSRLLADRVVLRLQASGVTVLDPSTTWVEEDCQVGADTVLEPGVVLRAACQVGEGCWIGAYSVLEGVVVPAGTRVPPLSYRRGGS
jgi:bifunctional UDP-N-acetylglucosamine pyrophosphorylase/glucosamine-1-phosphate N-acetyltransferase